MAMSGVTGTKYRKSMCNHIDITVSSPSVPTILLLAALMKYFTLSVRET